MATVLLLITTVLTALITGLFYAYSCSVVLGLGKLHNAEYLRAMQNINREILNPVFFTSFMGAVILLPASTFVFRGQQTVFTFLLLASLAYLVGVFGVTVAGNVPMNDRLDAFDISGASAEAVKKMRDGFESRWNFLNNIRTAFSVITIILVACACIWNRE